MNKHSKTSKSGGSKKNKKISLLLEPGVNSTSTSPLSTSISSEMTSVEQKKLQEMLALAQLEFQKINTSIVKEKKREIEALNTQIKEFIGPFMLIGYDLSNNPIEMVSASSPAEQDALLERLRRVMLKINQNIINSGGNDPYGLIGSG